MMAFVRHTIGKDVSNELLKVAPDVRYQKISLQRISMYSWIM